MSLKSGMFIIKRGIGVDERETILKGTEDVYTYTHTYVI